MQTEKTTPCPDDQTLRQVCMGDAPAPLSEQTLAHVEQCPACPGRIDSLWQKAYQHPSTAQNGALPQGIRNAPNGRANPLASLLARTGASHNLAFLKPSPYADMLGRLGPYDLIRVIGSGGNGIVFEAVDSREEGRSVAVKCLRPGRLGNPTTQERFLREAATPASIAHPGVPPILDHGIDGEVPYRVMPLLRGTDFHTLIQHHAPLPVAETIRLLEQICDILQAAHAKGIIHRDIKPSNLWLEKSPSGDSRVLLLDYGLATLAGEGSQLTQTGDMIGTPAYFSPEQAEGFTGGITPATDLFSLGAVAYELLTGRRVFPGQTPLEILRNMARFKFAHPKDLRPEIPQRLSDLVMSLLAWQPARRPASAAAVVQKLRHPALMRAPWFHRRNWLAYTATGTAAALGASYLGYRWFASRQPGAVFSPDNIFQLPGAITFDFNKLGDFYTEPNEVYWANAAGEVGTLSLVDRQVRRVATFAISPVDLRAGIRNLLVADSQGSLQISEMQAGKTGPVIPSPFDIAQAPKTPVHMLWSGNAGRFLVARDNQVCLLQLTEGTWKVIPYPQRFGGDSHITSLVHYPQGADSLRPFAATLANGWVVNFGFPSVQAYDKRLQTQGIDFRMASDTAGNLLALWSADGKLRVTPGLAIPEGERSYRIPKQFTADGRRVPIQPVDLQLARQKDLIVLHGEVEGKGIVALFSRRSNHLVAKLEVEDPIEMEIRGTDLWVLDRQGRLNQFHQFEKNF